VAFVLDVNLRIKEILGLQKVEAALSQVKGSAQTGVAVAGGAGAGGVAAGVGVQAAAATTLAGATNKVTVANNKLATSQTKAAGSTRVVAAGMGKASIKADGFSSSMKIAGQRYAAFLAVTVVPFAALGGIAKATAAVIEFDAAMLKVTQIMGRTIPQMESLRNTVLDLAANTGTSASELARVAQVLAQAGQRGDQLTESLSALSKVPLTPSFETIDAAIQGSIAALNQFRKEGLSTTEVLDVLTAVSNKFAASSEDIAKGISRGGAAFEAIGGTFREFVGVFTTIRQSTRESAETVGTFMKTISSRLADPNIVNFLEGKGIRISEAIEAGNPVEAIKRIAVALQNTVSIQDRIEIGTKLGGRRQISRLLALVSNIDVMNDAIGTANNSAGEFGRVAEQGLQSLQAQLNILVQEMNKLVQSLAQPLFVPIIRGATQLGKAFVFFIDTIKPVIPILTTIIGFAAGFKLLAISIGTASKALAFMSTVGIGGGIPAVLGSISAGGVAGVTARQRVQNRLAGGVGLSAGSAAAAGGVGARALGGLRGAATSPLGQLAGAAAIILASDKLSSSFREAGDSTGLMASEFIKAAAIIGIAGSLISGKSVVGAIGGALKLFTPFGGALATAIVALGAFTFAATKAVDLDIQSILDTAAQKVSETKVPDIEAGDIGSLQETVGGLGVISIDAIQESADRFEEGLSGSMASVVAGLGNLFQGEGLFAISDADAQQMTEDIVGNNPDLLNEIIRSAIQEFGGTGLESGLDQLLAQSFGGNIEAAGRIRRAMIKQAGGLNKIASSIKQSRLDVEISKLANAIEKASSDFRTLNVPIQLSSQLGLLSDSVGKAARAIESNVQTFNKLSQNIGRGIGIPLPDTDVSEKAVRNIVSSGQLGDFFDISRFKGLEGFATNVIDIGKGLDSFFDSIVASKAKSDSLVSLLKDQKVDPFDVFDDFLKEFEKTLPKKLPPEAKALFRATAGNIAGQLRSALTEKGGLLPDSDILEKAMADALGGQQPFFDASITIFTKWINAQNQQLNLELSGLELLAIKDIGTANLATTIANNLTKSLEAIGIDTGGLADIELGTVGAQQAIIDFGTNTKLIGNILNDLIPTTEDYANIFRKVNEATKDGGIASNALRRELGETGEKLINLQAIFELLKKSAELSPQAFADLQGRRRDAGLPTDEAGARRISELSGEIVEQMNRQRQLAEAQISIDVSQAFVEPAQFFADALVKSTDAIKVFTSALTQGDLRKGLSALNVTVTPEGRAFTQRRPVPEAVSTQQKILDRNTAQSAVFGGRIENVFETMRQVAATMAADSARRQLFSGDISGAVASGALSRMLDKFDGFIFDIPKLIGKSGLDSEAVARATAQALQEQAKQPAIKEIDFIGALNRPLTDLSESIQTLIQFPSVARQPEKLVPGLSQGLQDTILRLTPVPERVPETESAPRVFEQISSSASDIQQAASEIRMAADATEQSTEQTRVASTDMKQGGADMILASQGISDFATQMQVVADTQRETATSQQNASVAVAEGEGAREAIIQTTEAVNALGERVDAITNAVDVQTQQAAELAVEDAEEPLVVEGLGENTEAIAVNNEVASKTQESMGTLSDEMTTIAGAMKEGVGIDIETMSEIKVDVKGVASAAKEFTSEFEAVAERVVKEQIRVVLQQLASASGNSELSKTFESVV